MELIVKRKVEMCQDAWSGPGSQGRKVDWKCRAPTKVVMSARMACLSPTNQDIRTPAFRRQIAHETLANGRIKRRGKERRRGRKKGGQSSRFVFYHYQHQLRSSGYSAQHFSLLLYCTTHPHKMWILLLQILLAKGV